MIDRRTIRIVRAWAALDLLITGLLVLPPVADWLINLLLHINGWFGGQAMLEDITGLGMLFVCITGALGMVWAIARLLTPTWRLGAIDATARLWVGGLIIYFIFARGAPGILLLFVITEWVGGVHQGLRLAHANVQPQQAG